MTPEQVAAWRRNPWECPWCCNDRGRPLTFAVPSLTADHIRAVHHEDPEP